MAEAKILTKLFRSNIKPSVLSVLLSKYSTLIAEAHYFYTMFQFIFIYTH